MSDGAIIALIGFATVIAASVPTTVTAIMSRQARDHAKDAASASQRNAETLGETNGNGPLMQMMARSLGNQAELLRWQDEHADLDEQRLTDLLNRIVELSLYSHASIHELRNLLSPTVGKVDVMWKQYLADHGHELDIEPKENPE